jgi:periplasmic divalent cation tolerance protein
MDTAVIIFCACGSRAEAETIAHRLVEEHLAACVNILPPMESVYRWQGKVETASEHLLLIKTASEKQEALQDRLLQLHSYDTPEMIAIPVTSGLPKYLRWLHEQVTG